MRKILWIIVALVWVILAADARADTLFLTNGQTVWGKDIYEEGDSVVVVRPGGDLRFPKSQVSRIERTRSSLPPFYSPPAPTPAEGTAPAAPGAPGTPGAPGQPPSPGAPGTQPALPPPPGGLPPTAPPPGGTATQLPPPPPPPPPGR